MLLRIWFPVLGLGPLLAALPSAAPQPPGQSSFGVATESAAASRAALRISAAGGNAFDAGIAAAFVAGVTAPTSSGIGGGGFALLYSARDRRPLVLDFREVAGAAVDAAAFEQRPFADAERGRYVGVPGEVAGLFELHRRFGQLPWARVMAPAIEAAERGFAIEPHLAARLGDAPKLPIASSAAFRAAFLPAGKPAALGARATAPKLGRTLRRIASEGRRGFYEGPVARDLVHTVAAAGGALTAEDLTRYEVKEREPLRVTFAGRSVVTMPAPSAGGLLLAETLSLFSSEELATTAHNSAPYVHLLAEAMRGAMADRMRYAGDPAFEPFQPEALIAPARMRARRARIALDRTHTQPRYGLEESGTHHLVTADRDGNFLTLTTTVNRLFGAKLMAEDSGVILNDQLDDFTTAADVAVFGMSQSPNRPRPGARPVSSMTPTVVFENDAPVLALGGSGGLTISMNVTQVLLSRLVFGATWEAAVAAPRFFVPAPKSGSTLMIPPELASLTEQLQARGELVQVRDLGANAVQAVGLEAGRFVGAADPRKHGAFLAR